ncbi:MAG: hypothetical protein IJF56_03715 [Clostridia bacterium]|nr:hypothetical protein [Clostridia bacterium]
MGKNEDLLRQIEAESAARREKIRSAADVVTVRGVSYYVSNAGDDSADGLSPEQAWKTLRRVSEAALSPGDGVFFRRGDVFRGQVRAQAGVTYAAYGTGEKPRFYGWDKSLADPALWTPVEGAPHIWQLTEPILDCGTLVMNGGEAHCRKLIPSYIGGRFVCRDAEEKPFVLQHEMTQNLDMVCFYDARTTRTPSKGQDFPVPQLDDESLGVLVLRCEAGNPGAVYREIEALPRRNMFTVGDHPDVHIDNLCLKYIGCHAIGAGGPQVRGLHVSNCEIGWIGGAIQHYLGTDPNYPQGGRGTVTRYGNGVEIYGGCRDYTVENCWIYQVYDAGVTHQITTGGQPYRLEKIRYRGNLVEYCVYSIEYFLEKTGGDTESAIADCVIEENILRFSGYGWGQQRHNTDTPAHIKGWSYENTASGFEIRGNVFDRAAYRMLHLVAKKPESCPQLQGNTYVQQIGYPLGQYGANEQAEPPVQIFNDNAEHTVRTVFGDQTAVIVSIPT